MENMDPIYVIGHKNPDADAICSAIAYARYKQALGLEQYIPARCGNSNPRIDSILKRFNTELPLFLGDVTPRLKDIMVKDIIKLDSDATCADALNCIDQYDIRAIPIVTPDNILEGLVSIFDLGEYFIPKPGQLRNLRRVETSINSIITALKGEVLNGVDLDSVEEMFVRVGAMDIRSFGKVSQNEDIVWGQTIMIVGDRWDIQEKSIQSGVRLLVISGGLEVDEDIIENAREAGVSLIVSPLDSASTAWVIRTATRITPLIDTDFMTFSSEERVRQIRRRVANSPHPAFFILDEDRTLQGLFTKSELLKPVKTELVLVDHNEYSQAVSGAAEVNIREIIDHHRLGSLSTEQPILFINQPVGSTCTIVADLFRKARLEPDADLAGIMMSGMISDTLNLNSPTTTEVDKSILQWLSDLAQVSPDELSEMIFSSGSVVLGSAPAEVITSDQKIYDHGAIKYSVSQVEELGYSNFLERLDELRSALSEFKQKSGLYFAALLVTDINTQNSMLLLNADDEFLQSMNFSVRDQKDVYDMPNIVSRKKQLIPYFTSLLKGMGF